MSDTSPMLQKLRQMPASAADRKFRIPKKGRIRAALGLLLAAAAIATFISRSNGGDQNRSSPDGATVIDTVININTDTAIDTAAPKPKRSNMFSRFVKKQQDTAVVLPPRKPVKKLPDFMMSFDDVRRLIKDKDIGVDASEQIVITGDTDKPNDKGRWRGKDDAGDTLTVSLSIDTMLQKYARVMFRQYRPRYAAAAAIDPASGRVLALASFAHEDENYDGGPLYLRGIFPAASVFKTIVAAAGIEKGGMNAKTPIKHYGRRHTLYRTQIEEDLKVSEDITLQDAFAYSVNPAFARIALFNVSKDIVFDMGKRFGFNESIPFEYDIESSGMFYPDSAFSVAEFASGFNRQTSISPIFGALIAAAVCEGGDIYEPTVVDSIRSSKRDTLVYHREPALWRRPIRGQTAGEMRELMTSVTRYGTARKTFRPLRDSQKYGAFEFGGKTGNVNKLGLGRVDWYVGYARDPNDKTRRIAVGVVTTHGDYWTVQSSYIAAELMKKYIQQVTAAPVLQ